MNRLNSKTSMSTNRCDRPSPMLRRIPAGWQSRETNRNLLQRLLKGGFRCEITDYPRYVAQCLPTIPHTQSEIPPKHHLVG